MQVQLIIPNDYLIEKTLAFISSLIRPILSKGKKLMNNSTTAVTLLLISPYTSFLPTHIALLAVL